MVATNSPKSSCGRPRREDLHDPLSLLWVRIEPRPRLGNHLGTKAAIGKRSLTSANFGKACIDPREGRAHLGMNVFERARSYLYFGLGQSVPGSVCLDGPTREFTRGDALASAHLAQLLHALAWHQVLLAYEISF